MPGDTVDESVLPISTKVLQERVAKDYQQTTELAEGYPLV
jgi:hypothetical protein